MIDAAPHNDELTVAVGAKAAAPDTRAKVRASFMVILVIGGGDKELLIMKL